MNMTEFMIYINQRYINTINIDTSDFTDGLLKWIEDDKDIKSIIKTEIQNIYSNWIHDDEDFEYNGLIVYSLAMYLYWRESVLEWERFQSPKIEDKVNTSLFQSITTEIEIFDSKFIKTRNRGSFFEKGHVYDYGAIVKLIPSNRFEFNDRKTTLRFRYVDTNCKWIPRYDVDNSYCNVMYPHAGDSTLCLGTYSNKMVSSEFTDKEKALIITNDRNCNLNRDDSGSGLRYTPYFSIPKVIFNALLELFPLETEIKSKRMFAREHYKANPYPVLYELYEDEIILNFNFNSHGSEIDTFMYKMYKSVKYLYEKLPIDDSDFATTEEYFNNIITEEV